MIQSMTAFSQVQHQSESVIISWELRTINHRYLDISFRIPEQFRYLEPNLRLLIKNKVARGKLDFQLKINDSGFKSPSLVVNEPLVRSIIGVSKRLAVDYDLLDDVKLSQILSWPGVIQEESPPLDNLASVVESVFQQSLLQLVAGKQAEGRVLATEIKLRLKLLSDEISAAQRNTESFLTTAREKLMKRLDELQIKVEDTRLEQELAIILTRLDVSEELDRLKAHMHEVSRILDLSEPSGRRLDFLMQELTREANTLGSKSDNLVLSQHALQMKVLIDQMREQIQNIE